MCFFSYAKSPYRRKTKEPSQLHIRSCAMLHSKGSEQWAARRITNDFSVLPQNGNDENLEKRWNSTLKANERTSFSFPKKNWKI